MTKTFAMTSMLALLAACTGGSGGGNDGTIIAQDEGDTVQAALAEGRTVTAKSALMSAVILDRETGTAAPINPESFAMRLPDGEDEDVTILLGGREVTFTGGDRFFEEDGVTYYGWSQEGDNPRYALWAWSSGTASEAISLEGETFVNIWEVYFDDVDGSEYKAYAVTGTETAGSALTNPGTATYSGYAAIKAYPDGGYAGFDTVDRLEGDVSMTADFGDGTISGEMDNLRFGWTGDAADRDPIAGSIAMTESAIGSDGSYAGSLEADADLLAQTDDGTFSGSYAGDFFGPAAEQTAGALSAEFSAGGTDYQGSGFYNTFIDE